MRHYLAIATAFVATVLVPTGDANAQADAPRVFHAPTAWVQDAGTAHGSAGLTHRGGGFLAVTGGLGRLADLEVTVSDRLDTDGDEQLFYGSAQFKLGLGGGVLWKGPAIAVGFRKSFRADVAAGNARIGELFVATSAHLGPVTLHGGGTLWHAAYDDRAGELEPTVRGFAGAEYRPPKYPKTTLLADFASVPRLEDTISLGWVAGWGVRYQALSWGSIELGVRHRDEERIDDATVFVRVNGRR